MNGVRKNGVGVRLLAAAATGKEMGGKTRAAEVASAVLCCYCYCSVCDDNSSSNSSIVLVGRIMIAKTQLQPHTQHWHASWQSGGQQMAYRS